MKFISSNTIFYSDCLRLEKVDRHYYLSAGDINPATGKAYAINPSTGNWDDNYFASHYGNSGSSSSSSGNSGSDASIITQFLSDQANKQSQQEAANKAQLDTEFAQDKTDLNNFNTGFSQAVPGIISAADQKYNIPSLVSYTNALNDRISTLKGNTDNSGAGGYASADQVDSALNTNYLPKFLTATQDLQTGESQAQNEVQTNLTPWTTQASLLNDRMAREATGYTTQQQSELDALLQQMNSGVTLTDTQMSNANQLAIAEQEYATQLQAAQIGANATTNAAKIGQTYQTLNPGQVLFNTASGQSYNPYG